jgi:protein TonB
MVLTLASPRALAAQQPEPAMLAEAVDLRPVLFDSTCLKPRYPDILRQAGIEGYVQLEFIVDTNGAVDTESIRVLSSTHQLFEPRARAAIASCRYRPGSLNGQSVRVRMRRSLNFVLPAR